MKFPEPELILEHEQKVRRTIDPHICSLRLRPMTNDPSEGYRLAVSCNFGSERVDVKIEKETVSFRLEIFRAEVVLDTAHCSLDPEFQPDGSSLVRLPAQVSGPKPETKNRFLVDTGELIASQTGARVQFEREVVSSGRSLESYYETSIVDEKTIKIESAGEELIPLSGNLLDGFSLAHILPDRSKDSGVLGRVRVREDWIRLVNPTASSVGGKLIEKIREIIYGEDESDRYRRKAFHLLLTHCVVCGLQSKSDEKEATIACDTAIVRKNDERFQRLDGESPSGSLELEGTIISRFLSARRNEIPGLLVEAGVSSERIGGIAWAAEETSENDTEMFIILNRFVDQHLATIGLAPHTSSIQLADSYTKFDTHSVCVASIAAGMLPSDYPKPNADVLTLEAKLKTGIRGAPVLSAWRAVSEEDNEKITLNKMTFAEVAEAVFGRERYKTYFEKFSEVIFLKISQAANRFDDGL